MYILLLWVQDIIYPRNSPRTLVSCLTSQSQCAFLWGRQEKAITVCSLAEKIFRHLSLCLSVSFPSPLRPAHTHTYTQREKAKQNHHPVFLILLLIVTLLTTCRNLLMDQRKHLWEKPATQLSTHRWLSAPECPSSTQSRPLTQSQTLPTAEIKNSGEGCLFQTPHLARALQSWTSSFPSTIFPTGLWVQILFSSRP